MMCFLVSCISQKERQRNFPRAHLRLAEELQSDLLLPRGQQLGAAVALAELLAPEQQLEGGARVEPHLLRRGALLRDGAALHRRGRLHTLWPAPRVAWMMICQSALLSHAGNSQLVSSLIFFSSTRFRSPLCGVSGSPSPSQLDPKP